MNSKQKKTLEQIFRRPDSASIRWEDIESLFTALGAKITEAEGSRVCVRLFGGIQVFHRPHPSPCADKGAVASIRKWLKKNGVMP